MSATSPQPRYQAHALSGAHHRLFRTSSSGLVFSQVLRKLAYGAETPQVDDDDGDDRIIRDMVDAELVKAASEESASEAKAESEMRCPLFRS